MSSSGIMLNLRFAKICLLVKKFKWIHTRQHTQSTGIFISYHLFSFRGSIQDYKIHMETEIVNAVHKNNKNICLRSQEVKAV